MQRIPRRQYTDDFRAIAESDDGADQAARRLAPASTATPLVNVTPAMILGRLLHGFVYLTAVIDWYSRKVLSWRISNSMDAAFCVDCLQAALSRYGKPKIFNSDPGSQFTSGTFMNVLNDAKVVISMDGRGRALGNILPNGCDAMSNREKLCAVKWGFHMKPDEALLEMEDDPPEPACRAGFKRKRCE